MIVSYPSHKSVNSAMETGELLIRRAGEDTFEVTVHRVGREVT